MSLLCRLFGHRFDRFAYARVFRTGIDGLGVEHARVEGECKRCGDRASVCSIHLPAREAERNLVRAAVNNSNARKLREAAVAAASEIDEAARNIDEMNRLMCSAARRFAEAIEAASMAACVPAAVEERRRAD